MFLIAVYYTLEYLLLECVTFQCVTKSPVSSNRGLGKNAVDFLILFIILRMHNQNKSILFHPHRFVIYIRIDLLLFFCFSSIHFPRTSRKFKFFGTLFHFFFFSLNSSFRIGAIVILLHILSNPIKTCA